MSLVLRGLGVALLAVLGYIAFGPRGMGVGMV